MLKNRHFIATSEFAKLLGLDIRTLANERSAGRSRIPYYKFNGRIAYAVADVEAYLEASRVAA